MKLYPIHITNFKIDGGAMFGVVPKVIWQRKYPADENNLCTWAIRSLLIKTEDRNILIDTGYGNKQSEKFFSYVHLHDGEGLEGSLLKSGTKLDDITDVVLTHLHADHCGGSTKYNADKTKFEAVFKNARHWISKQQWDSAIVPNLREADAFLEENILSIQETGKINFIEENTEIIPGVELRLFNGHTAGQIVPFIKHNDKTIVFAADLIPSTAHIPLVYNMSYDLLPLVTIKEKQDVLKEAIDKNYILFFQHDAYNECCTLKNTPKGIREDKTFTLNEYLK